MCKRRSIARLWLIGSLFLFPGCAGTDLDLPAPSPLSFEELRQKVSRVKGLTLQPELSLESRPAEEIQALVESSRPIERERDDLQRKARVYARLGLLPEATDLPKALSDLRLLRQVVLPDFQRKTIFLPNGPLSPAFIPLALSSTAQETARQLLIVQALCYFLQEQHFQWEGTIRNGSTEDLKLSLRALREGDALLVGFAHLLGESEENRPKVIDRLRSLERFPAATDEGLSRLPEMLRQKLAFQYLQGSRFVSWAYALRGWAGVNSLFLDPPASTKQILHPEKYYVKRERPIRITPWKLIRQFGGQMFMDETLGEFLIQALLSRNLTRAEATQAAEGWTGDSLLAFQQAGELILGWVTAWDDPDEAKQFHAGLRRALERRHAVSFEPSRSRDILTAAAQDSRSLLLQVRERFVLFLDGVSPPLAVKLAEDLWNDLETGTEPELLDLANRYYRSRSRRK